MMRVGGKLSRRHDRCKHLSQYVMGHWWKSLDDLQPLWKIQWKAPKKRTNAFFRASTIGTSPDHRPPAWTDKEMIRGRSPTETMLLGRNSLVSSVDPTWNHLHKETPRFPNGFLVLTISKAFIDILPTTSGWTKIADQMRIVFFKNFVKGVHIVEVDNIDN